VINFGGGGDAYGFLNLDEELGMLLSTNVLLVSNLIVDAFSFSFILIFGSHRSA